MGHKKSQKHSKQCSPVIVIQGQKNRDCSDSSRCHKKETVKGDLKVCGNAHFKKDVKIDRSLTVKGDTTLNNVTINGDITPVNGTFTVGIDFPTIQATFDFLKGKVVDDVLIIVPSPSSGIRTYDELIDTRGIISVPSQGEVLPPANYPLVNFSDLTLLQRGLGIRGDPRYFAGLTYINTAQLNYFMDYNYTTNKYVQQLGTPFGIVALSRPGANQIQVNIVAAPANVPSETNIVGPAPLADPDFTTVDIQIGDHILIRDQNGNYNERAITAVAPTVLTYDGIDVPSSAYGVGTSLFLCPRVKITSSIPTPDGGIVLLACGIAVQGIWFQGNSSGGDVVDVWYDAVVKMSSCLSDGGEDFNSFSCVGVGFQSQVGSEVSGIRQHNTCIRATWGLSALDGARVDDGDWAVFDCLNNVFAREATAQVLLNSLNSVGAIETNLLVDCNAMCKINGLLGSYSSYGVGGFAGIAVSRGAQLSILYNNLQIDQSITGYNGLDVSRGGLFNMSSTLVYPSLITGDPAFSRGITSRAGSNVVFQNTVPVTLNNLETGIIEQAASLVVFQGDVAFTGTMPNPRVVEVDSKYSAVNSTGTPYGIFSYTTGGSYTMDSTSQNQYIDPSATTPVLLAMDPSASVHGVSLYVGKHYYLCANNNQINTLTLAVGTFIGAGVTGTPHVLTLNPVAGACAHLLVLSTSIVQIISINNAQAPLFIETANTIGTQKKILQLPERLKCDRINRYPHSKRQVEIIA